MTAMAPALDEVNLNASGAAALKELPVEEAEELLELAVPAGGTDACV
jgi:hypothetical protein